MVQVYRMAANDSIPEPVVADPWAEEEPPTGVVTPINDCQTNFAATFPQGTPERDFLNEHPEIEVALDGVLFKTNDCEEDTTFANWAIDYLMEYPETPVELVLTARYLDCLKVNQLASVFPNAPTENLKKFCDHVRVYGHFFGLNTKEKLYHFIAQVGGETGGLATLNATENLNYTTEARLREIYYEFNLIRNPNAIEDVEPYLNNSQGLANLVYCCDNENGNESSGDGWRYRGRGVLQLTWKSNYREYAEYLNSIGLGWFYNSPDDIAAPNGLHSILSGMWFFKTRVLDKLSVDESTTSRKVTQRVNKYSDKRTINAKQFFFNKINQNLNCN